MASGLNIYSELLISRIGIQEFQFLISTMQIVDIKNCKYKRDAVLLVSVIPVVDIRNTNC